MVKKTLHCQLSKVILYGMYNCNFEAINQVLNTRMKKIRNGTWTIHLHNHPLYDILYQIQERVSYVKFRFRTSTFLVIAFVDSYNYDLNYKQGNFSQLLKVFLIYSILSFVSIMFSMQPQLLLTLVQFEADSNNMQGKTKSFKQSHKGA